MCLAVIIKIKKKRNYDPLKEYKKLILNYNYDTK